MCGFFVMCGCVYVWVFCNVWVCVCVGFCNFCVCVCVGFCNFLYIYIHLFHSMFHYIIVILHASFFHVINHALLSNLLLCILYLSQLPVKSLNVCYAFCYVTSALLSYS